MTEKGKNKVPPGQNVVDEYPIMHEGEVIKIPAPDWTLKLTGLVKEEKVLSYRQLLDLGVVKLVKDFHCVTGWSKLDDEWEGVLVKDVINYAEVLAEARYVMVYDAGMYSSNMPISSLMDDAMLAIKIGGKDIAYEQGGPVRLFVPSLYAYKSVKWPAVFDFVKEDKHGYWEDRGYSNKANPWEETRYSSDD